MAGQQAERGRNMLTTLEGARDKQTGNSLSREEIFFETMTLLGAGHETTSNTLSWALHLLARHPEAQRRLAEELRSEVAADVPTKEETKRLRFTRAVRAVRRY